MATQTFPFKANPYIIAEAGSCHENDPRVAKALVEHAHRAGAHAIKFQLFNGARLAQRRNAGLFQPTYEKYQLPHEWLPILRDSAHRHNLDLVLSVYDQEDLSIARHYADVLKISSFESEDSVLLCACHATGLPVIVSTGISHGQEVINLRVETKVLGNIFVLHCVSAYPCKMEHLHLSSIRQYVLDGFSDHSRNVLTGALAVSHGARILEVHIRAYNTDKGNPDYPHSLDPEELQHYVYNAQLAKSAIGTPRVDVLECEAVCAPFKVNAEK